MSRMVIDDEMWSRLEKLLPKPKGRHGKDDRLFIEAIGWMLRTGAAWRDLPPAYGNWKSVYNRYNNWSKKGYITATRYDKTARMYLTGVMFASVLLALK